jgi:hypothetical protein
MATPPRMALVINPISSLIHNRDASNPFVTEGPTPIVRRSSTTTISQKSVPPPLSFAYDPRHTISITHSLKKTNASLWNSYNKTYLSRQHYRRSTSPCTWEPDPSPSRSIMIAFWTTGKYLYIDERKREGVSQSPIIHLPPYGSICFFINGFTIVIEHKTLGWD